MIYNYRLRRIEQEQVLDTILAIRHQQFQHMFSVRNRLAGSSASVTSSVPSDVCPGRQFPRGKSTVWKEPLLVEETQEVLSPTPPPSPIAPDPTRSRGLNHYEMEAVNRDLAAVASGSGGEKGNEMKEVEEVETKEVEEVETKGGEEVETKGGEEVETKEVEEVEEDPPQHHVLDPLIEKVLTRQEQDALYVDKGGKQRGRGKGKGKGRGRGKQAKDPVCRTLFPSDEESFDTPGTGDVFEPVPPKPKGTAKAKAKAASVKRPAAAPSSLRKPKAEAVPPVDVPATKKRARKPKEEPKPKEDDANKERKTRKRPNKEQDTQQPKPKVERVPIPVFQNCSVVPYWSRLACGLKVPCNLGNEGGEPISKTGLRQAFYVCVKGAAMKEHVDLIVEMVPGF